jgi:hypothetical protein
MAATATFNLFLASPAVALMEKKKYGKQARRLRALLAILQYRIHVNDHKMTGRHEEL